MEEYENNPRFLNRPLQEVFGKSKDKPQRKWDYEIPNKDFGMDYEIVTKKQLLQMPDSYLQEKKIFELNERG